MTARTSLVKSSLLTLGLGAALAAPSASQAQTVSIVYTGGGSSALLGNFSATPALGAIPLLLLKNPTAVQGFEPGGFTNLGALYNPSVAITDPSTGFNEGTTPGLVLYAGSPSGQINVVILVRSDSGFGVRYVANGERIKSWGAFSVASTPYTNNDSTIDTAVENYLTSNANTSVENVYNGLSDVSADAIIALSGFQSSAAPIRTASLANVTNNPLAVQTLSFIYNSGHSTGGVLNVTRTLAKSLVGGLPGAPTFTGAGGPITWAEVAPGDNTNPVDVYFRENSSGTRSTEILDVQRYGTPTAASGIGAFVYTENTLGNDPVTATTSGLAVGFAQKVLTQPVVILPTNTTTTVAVTYNANGTGNMLSAVAGDSTGAGVILPAGTVPSGSTASVSGDPNGFGYAFITGTAGNHKFNGKVATFDGVAPFSFSGGNGIPASFPATAATSYTTTANGQYELWSYANQYRAANAPTTQLQLADQIYLLINNSAGANDLHSLGFTSVSEMKVARAGFQSSYINENEVTDGMLITYDTDDFTINPNGTTPPNYGQSANFGSVGGDDTVIQ